jgi:hypothetical protein
MGEEYILLWREEPPMCSVGGSACLRFRGQLVEGCVGSRVMRSNFHLTLRAVVRTERKLSTWQESKLDK